MRRPQEIGKERQAMTSIVQLTGAFEGIASAHIARIKTQVERSQQFFDELWPVYTRLRVGKEFRHGRTEATAPIDKELLIIITAEGSLSGDIDMRLVERLVKVYTPRTHDIVVIGHHGATLLQQREIKPKEVFRLPAQDEELATAAILAYVQQYKMTMVYYQAYLSLMKQEIKNISLSAVVQERGETTERTDENAYISDLNYIFEPTVREVVGYMERSMLGVALNEVVLESKLAQQASRFRAMSAARTRAKEAEQDLVQQFNHAGRALKDERTREIVNTLRTKGVMA